MFIRLIKTGTPEYEAMINLRMNVLLDPIGIPRSYINPEKEKYDFLLGAFEEEKLVGCCILTPTDDKTLQLRQMAVDTSRQTKGVGTAIVAFAEMLGREKDYQVLMMHARDTVLE